MREFFRLRGDRSRLPVFAAFAALPFILWTLILAHGFHPVRHGPALNMAAFYDGYTTSMLRQGSPFSPVLPNLGFPVGSRQNFGWPAEIFSAFTVQMTGCDPITAHQIFGCVCLIVGYLSLATICFAYTRCWVASLLSPCLYYFSSAAYQGHSYFYLEYSFILFPFYLLVNGIFIRKCFQGSVFETMLLAAPVLAVNSFAVLLDAYSAVFSLTATAVLAALRGLDAWRCSSGAVRALLLAAAATLPPFALFAGAYGSGAAAPRPDLDFLRGQGIDLATVLIPTHDSPPAHWLNAPIQGWNPHGFYGDGGNSRFNYIGIPLLASGLTGLFFLWRRRRSFSSAAPLAAGLVGMTLALGPSLKIHDVRDEATFTDHLSSRDFFMPAEAASATLPTSVLFEFTPLRSFRVVNRWQILFRCALVIGFAAVASTLGGRLVVAGAALFLLTLADTSFYPACRLGEINETFRKDYKLFLREVIAPLEWDLRATDRVLFLPAQNDYLAPPIAARTGASLYNTTPDKELSRALARRPENVSRLISSHAQGELKGEAILQAFRLHLLDAVVLTKFKLQHFGGHWPPSGSVPVDETLAALRLPARAGDDDALCGRSREWYVMIKPCAVAEGELVDLLSTKIDFSLDGNAARFLHRGFSRPEPWGVWTDGPFVELLFPIDRPIDGDVEFIAAVHAYSSEAYPRDRRAAIRVNGEVVGEWRFEHPPRAVEKTVRVPRELIAGDDLLKIEFHIPDATSPTVLGLPPGARGLGIAFRSARFEAVERDAAR